MPRNTAGNYTLPLPPVVAGDDIESVWANTTLDDVGNALTDSLDRHGRGGMLAPFLFFDGSEGAPGAAFANQPGTGMWRDSSSLQFSVGGVAQLKLDAAGVTVPLQIFQAAAPATAQSLANKAYVDAVSATIAAYLPLAGGTLTGALVGPSGSFTDLLFGGGNRAGLLYSPAPDQVGLRVGDAAGPDFSFFTFSHGGLNINNGALSVNNYVQAAGGGTDGHLPAQCMFRGTGPFGGGFGMWDGAASMARYMQSGEGKVSLNDGAGRFAVFSYSAIDGGTFSAGKLQASIDSANYCIVYPAWDGGRSGYYAGRAGNSFSLTQASDGSTNLIVNGRDVFGADASGNPYIKGRADTFVQRGSGVTNGSGNATITFPVAFGGAPTVTVLGRQATPYNWWQSSAPSATQAFIGSGFPGGGATTVNFDWIAVGPYP